MGGLCSKKSTEDIFPTEELTHGNDNHTHGSEVISQTQGLPVQGNNDSTLSSARESFDRQLREPFSFPNVNAISYGMNADDNNDGIPRFSRVLSSNSRSTKSKQLTGAKVSTTGLTWIVILFIYFPPCVLFICAFNSSRLFVLITVNNFFFSVWS